MATITRIIVKKLSITVRRPNFENLFATSRLRGHSFFPGYNRLMSQINGLGIGRSQLPAPERSGTQYVMRQRMLQRVLALRGRTIDDVVNDPIVKNDILGYWKVLKQIDRRSEMLELERQWNHLGQRV